MSWLSYYIVIFESSEILTEKRLVGKPRSKWLGNINSILKKLLGGGVQLIYLVQNTGPVSGSYINGYENKGYTECPVRKLSVQQEKLSFRRYLKNIHNNYRQKHFTETTTHSLLRERISYQ